MKTKLLRRWKKAIEKHLCLDKDFILTPQTYDAAKQKYIKDETRIVYLRADKPVAPILWKELDVKSNWFMRYWKHSRWKNKIQLLAAAKGISESAAAIEVLEERRSYQAKHLSIVVPSLHKVVPTLIPESAIQPNSITKSLISFNAIIQKVMLWMEYAQENQTET